MHTHSDIPQKKADFWTNFNANAELITTATNSLGGFLFGYALFQEIENEEPAKYILAIVATVSVLLAFASRYTHKVFNKQYQSPANNELDIPLNVIEVQDEDANDSDGTDSSISIELTEDIDETYHALEPIEHHGHHAAVPITPIQKLALTADFINHLLEYSSPIATTIALFKKIREFSFWSKFGILSGTLAISALGSIAPVRNEYRAIVKENQNARPGADHCDHHHNHEEHGHSHSYHCGDVFSMLNAMLEYVKISSLGFDGINYAISFIHDDSNLSEPSLNTLLGTSIPIAILAFFVWYNTLKMNQHFEEDCSHESSDSLVSLKKIPSRLTWFQLISLLCQAPCTALDNSSSLVSVSSFFRGARQLPLSLKLIILGLALLVGSGATVAPLRTNVGIYRQKNEKERPSSCLRM